VPVPRLYYGAADDASRQVVLLLEEVRSVSAGDVLSGCTPGQEAQVLHALAPMHGQWWGQDLVGQFRWLPPWAGDPVARQARYNAQLGPFLRRFAGQLVPGVHDLLTRLQQDYHRVLYRLAQAPTTLIHADLHLDNILFSLPGHPSALIVLDWQTVSRGPAAVDLAVLLATSLSVEQRRANARDLVAAYHALLVAHGAAGYPLEDLRMHWRLALLWLLAGTVGWLSSTEVEHLRGRERALLEAALGDGRLISLLLDEDVLSLLPRTTP